MSGSGKREVIVAAALAAATVLSVPAFLAGAANAHGAALKGSGGVAVRASAPIMFWCSALATEPAAAVSVDECRLYANGRVVGEAKSVALSGPTAVTGGVAPVDWLTSTLTVCWSVSTDPVLGGHREEDVGCMTSPR